MNFRHLQGDFWSDLGSFGVPWGGILVTLGGPWTGWYFSEFQGVARGGPKAKSTGHTVGWGCFFGLGGRPLLSRKPVTSNYSTTLLSLMAPTTGGPADILLY